MTEESLFLAALERNDPNERQAFLRQACGEDALLYHRVERLLAAYDAGQQKLEPPTGPACEKAGEGSLATVDHGSAAPGAVIAGRYRLLERIGEGGMGEVWVAKQTEPVQRTVALKLIRADRDSRQVVARFEAERQALALMDHPNIARVLDGGATETARPFFVMELVNGLSLTKYCDEAKLTPKQRLELFVPICQAVQHAHQKGIVHRDLKPANVLVTLYDGKPVPKIIDFGVAKATGGRLTDESLATQFGAVVGTFEYMAPEQAGFSALDVDTRADIYSLGVILYELLTGLRPFDSKRLRKAALDEMVRILREEEPPRPSTRLSTDDSAPSLAALRQTDPKRLTALMRGELDWIVMKCLEKDRNRRYETANGLAADLRHYLADEPVQAGPPSASYRLRKFVRRNCGPVAAAAAMAALLVIGAAVSAWQAWRATVAEGLAEVRREAAEVAELQAKDDRDEADKQRRRAEHSLYIANIHRIRFELENNNISAARTLLDLYRPGRGEGVRPGWEWHYWDRVCHAALHTLKGHQGRVTAVAYSPDGMLLASAGNDGVKIWNMVTGEEARTLLHGVKSLISQVAFSPDGKVLATRGLPGTVKLWDTATWNEVPGWAPEPGDRFQRVAFSPDGKTLAMSDAITKRVKFWDLVGKKWAGQLPEGTGSNQIYYSTDGRRMAVGRDDGVQLWDVTRQTLLWARRGHSFTDLEAGGIILEAITGIAFCSDGQLLATCGKDGTVKLRKVSDGTEVRTITVLAAGLRTMTGLTALAFSPDGKQLVTSGFGSPIKLYEVATGREGRTFFGEVGATTVSFSPDGTRLASASNSGEVKIWDATGEPGQHLFLDEMFYCGKPKYSPDGLLLAAPVIYSAKSGQVQVRDVETGRLVFCLDERPSWFSAFAFSSDGAQLAAVLFRADPGDKEIAGRPRKTLSREIQLWDLKSRQQVAVITGLKGSITQLAFSPGDRLLAAVVKRFDSNTKKWTGEVKMWNAKTRKEQRSFPGTEMAFSPNGDTLAVVDNDESVKVFDPVTGRLPRSFPSRPGQMGVAFSPDGHRLFDGRTVWNVTDGREVCTLKGNGANAEFSPDGMRLFSLSPISRGSGFLRVWDAATGDLLASISVPADRGVSLHPDGWRCAVASVSTGTWIIDARPLTPELRRKRDAHNLVVHLVRKPMLKEEILDHLSRMKTISEPLRREARALATALDYPAEVLQAAAGDIVEHPDRSEDEYRRALRWMEEADRLSPNNGGVVSTLGEARYRLGQYKEAAVTLKRAFTINTSGYFFPPAADLVFLAMAQHRLGQKEEARKTLARARNPRFSQGPFSPHLWREAEVLIEGKKD